MWLEQEWHVWVGLGVGVAGLIVGVGAWIHAARASSTATRVSTALTTFKTDLERRLEDERLLKTTPPVVVPPAALVPVQADNGDLHIANGGEGTAYNVRIEPATVFTAIAGQDRWGEIPPGQSVKVILRSSSLSTPPAVHVYWQESASGEVEHRELTFLFRRR